MYGLYGIEKSITNIYQLAAPFVGETEIKRMADLKPSYIEFLKTLHPEFPIDLKNDLFVTDRDRSQKLIDGFSASAINDLNQERMVGDFHSDALLDANISLVKRSLETLALRNPELHELFELAAHSLLLRGSGRNAEGRKAHGGTTSKCVGLIWLNLNPETSRHNVLEMLVHELTHTLVFIDELNHGHFNYANLTKKEFWAMSSILKRVRPMDKVVHSILVSLELLNARKTYLQTTETELLHPDSDSLRTSLNASIDSVLNHPRVEDVCLPRALELVQDARQRLQKI